MFLKQSFIIKESIILWIVFSVVLLIHFKSHVITSTDSALSISTAISIIKQGNIDLDEFLKDNKIDNCYVCKGQWVKGHFYNTYPLGSVIMAVPFVYILGETLDYDVILRYFFKVELLVASFIIALCTLFMYLVARQYLNKMQSLLITFIFAFCTPAWSTASRALWQHGPSMLMLTITLYLFILARKKPFLAQFAGLSLAFSYLTRPLDIESLVVFTAFVLIYYKKYFFKYALWGSIILTPFFIYNSSTYGSIVPPYYKLSCQLYIFSKETFFEAFFGHAISPSRGLFIFSPILLFSGYGIFLKIKSKEFKELDIFLLGIIFIHWVAVSFFKYWWAGWSIGPRYISDIVPFFIYFLIPVFRQYFNIKSIKSSLFVFLILIVLSFFINYRCANDPRAWAWNGEPVNVDNYPDRVWDWNDIQFLRGIEYKIPFLKAAQSQFQ